METNTNKPTEDQLTALCTFARANGRRWKAALRDCWETGAYDRYSGIDETQVAYLQQVRNTLGPSWLARFSVPK